MEEINCYNLQDYVTYRVNKEYSKIEILWDGTNKQLNYLMSNEELCGSSNDHFTNSLWVDEIKKMMEWEEGETISVWRYTFLEPGKMVIFVIVPLIFNYQYLKIDEDGYLLLKEDGDIQNQTFRKCNCLYNDLIDEESEPYIFK
jgi:hypothetical protein